MKTRDNSSADFHSAMVSAVLQVSSKDESSSFLTRATSDNWPHFASARFGMLF
jgi:hypothetical protein